MRSYRVHLVCSGGGVLCLSYIGAIQKLKEHNIEIASVSTCSMGAFIGALVCTGIDLKKLEEALLEFKFTSLHKRKFWYWLNAIKYPYSAYKKPDFIKAFKELSITDIPIGELAIPFATTALDLRQRSMLAYSSDQHGEMMLSEILKIATAIPPISEPYKKGRHLLVDGAVASESPVWMAANFKGAYPILVLKPAPSPEEDYKISFPRFLYTLFNAAAASHDCFYLSQIPRAIEIKINCGNLKPEDFRISRDQKERLIVEGGTALEKELKAVGGNFNNILKVEKLGALSHTANTTDRAAKVANQMISKYHKEIGNRNQVFISYNRKDKAWLEKLQTYMRSVERFTSIKIWDDTDIVPGSKWEPEIERALQATRVAILLVTQNFLDSDFIQQKEVKYLLNIAQKEKVSILWVAVSACTYELTPLKDIQCANNPKMPLDQLSEAMQNVEFTKICDVMIKAMDLTSHPNRA